VQRHACRIWDKTWKQQQMEVSREGYNYELSRGVDKHFKRPPHPVSMMLKQARPMLAAILCT
jgi:hypothetical protein